MRKKRNRYRQDRKIRVRQWTKRARALVVLMMILPALYALSFALAHSYHALLDGPWFRLEDIEISGIKNVDRREILNILGIPRNASLLTVKVSERAKALDTIPWLRAANVSVSLPHRIQVDVQEREPVAVVFADDFFLMDEEGRLFVKTAAGAYPNLPLVSGFSKTGLKQGDYLPGDVLDAFRKLTRALEGVRGWLPPNQISECRWHNEEGFILYTTLKAIPIELGWDDYDLKMGRLQKILGQLSQRRLLEAVTRIDLDYPSRAFVAGSFPVPKGI